MAESSIGQPFLRMKLASKHFPTIIEIYAAIKISIFFHGPSNVRQTERTESLGADFILYLFYFVHSDLHKAPKFVMKERSQ